MSFIILSIEVLGLTNINCSANCIYQKEGKCTLENISAKAISFNSNCAYFYEKK